MDVLEALGQVGLTRHESLLYLTLCKEGELSGYEAAKLSGIPRSNAYLALAGLVEKGGAFRSEGQAVRYAAVPPREWVASLRREYERIFGFLEANLPEREQSGDSFLTITGEKQVTDKIKNIINQAQARIYLAADRSELQSVVPELREAVSRGLKVVVMTDGPWNLEGCRMYQRPHPSGQLRLIADSSEVLTGEWQTGGVNRCIYSRNPNLVQLIKDSLTNEIKLLEIGKSGNYPG